MIRTECMTDEYKNVQVYIKFRLINPISTIAILY